MSILLSTVKIFFYLLLYLIQQIFVHFMFCFYLFLDFSLEKYIDLIQIDTNISCFINI